MGIRASLGAGHGRLLSQLITESLILSALGGLVGLGLAFSAGTVIPATLAMNTNRTFTPDGTVLAVVILLSTLAAVLFGTAPAWKLARTDVRSLVQRPGQIRTRAWGRTSLVVGQTVLSVLLLIRGGLLARSVQEGQKVDLGGDPDRKLVMSLLLDNAGYGEEEGPAFLQEALREPSPNLTMARMTLAGLVREQFSTWRIRASLISVLSAVALLLAVVGLYGVQSFLVSQRTKEVGIRLALGAEKRSVVGRVVRSGLLTGLLGVVLGVGVALAFSGLLRGMVFGVAPNDPLVFTVVPALLLLACLAAILIPALRASSVNPVEALRRE